MQGFIKFLKLLHIKTSLLRRLQAQTLSDATPLMGNIHPFSKMDMIYDIVYFIPGRAISNRLGVAALLSCGRKMMTYQLY